MRHVTKVEREKDIYNIKLKELKEGKWLELIQDANELLEINYVKGYLTIQKCKIKNSEAEKARGEQNGEYRRLDENKRQREYSSGDKERNF